MDRIGMIRLDRENLPIDLLGSLQPAGLMVLDRNRQCFGNRCHEANYGNTTCQPQYAQASEWSLTARNRRQQHGQDCS